MPETATPPDEQAEAETPLCVIPSSVYQQVEDGLGKYFEPIARIPRDVLAKDMLKTDRAVKHIEILKRYVDIQGKRFLEIGSGYGTNLIVWIKHFGIDAIGVEPEGEGFSSTIDVSRELCRLNGVDADRVMASRGEELPFPDESFDIAYSSYALEHTEHPDRVLEEAIRVLRPGGILHFEIPNYLAYFEGHYFVLQPPILWKGLLPFWVKTVCRRDPHFATTLRTEINPVWVRRVLRKLGAKYDLEVVSLGEELFIERLRGAFKFETGASQSRIAPIIKTLALLNYKDMVSKMLILLKAHYPIYLTVHKRGSTGSRAS
jgi:ubiquinone/menaquinone biosynthesis C-methylase UbiE